MTVIDERIQEAICKAIRSYMYPILEEYDLMLYFYLVYQTHGNGD